MSNVKTWVLTDVERGIWFERFETEADEPEAMPWSVRKETLRGGLRDGVDVVNVDNGVLSFSVVPTRGMGLWRGACRGMSLGWDAPVKGPVNPMFVNLLDRAGLGWLQGFDEWIVRCGLGSNGAPGKDTVPDNNGNPAVIDLTLHGRIANLPATRVVVEVTPGAPPELALVGEVEESMLFAPRLRLRTRISTRIGSSALTIVDEVTNAGGTAAEAQLLYHCNFGPPFLEAGGRVVMPCTELAPRDARAVEGISTWDRFEAPTPGYVEQVYFSRLAADAAGNTAALLRNAAGDKGVTVRFNVGEMPCFTLWKNTAALADGYVTGLEPGTNFPNPKAFERRQNRVVTLAPGQSCRAALTIEVQASAGEVQRVEAEIAALGRGARSLVHPRPVAGFSAVEAS